MENNKELAIVDITCFCNCTYTVTIEKTPWTQEVFTICPKCGAINLAYEDNDFKIERGINDN